MAKVDRTFRFFHYLLIILVKLGEYITLTCANEQDKGNMLFERRNKVNSGIFNVDNYFILITILSNNPYYFIFRA